MSKNICKYCHDKDDGWVREDDGFGGLQWTHCVCMPTNPFHHDHNGRSPEENDWNRMIFIDGHKLTNY